MIRNIGTPWTTIARVLLGASLIFISYESPRLARAAATPAEQTSAEEAPTNQAAADQAAADQPASEQPATEELTAEEMQQLPPELLRRLEAYKSIKWQTGPATGALGGRATVQVPENFKLTTGPGCAAFLEFTQNVPDPALLGVLVPNDGADWFLTFTYVDSGHVADDEQEKLDANAILTSYREGAEAANEERKRRGWSELHVTGWLQPPAYDPATKHLAWAIKAQSDGSDIANYDLRLLSRQGVMNVGLVASPDQIPQLIPQVKQLIGGFEFTPGNKWGEFREGDKVAEIGLIGLITGGAAIAAAKTGLLAKIGVMFAKFAKIILIGAAAVGAAVVKFSSRIFGSKTEPNESS